jgi:hypothetical protein
MLLIDNTVEVHKSLKEILINFINGNKIVSGIYTVTECEIYKKPRLTGHLKKEGRYKPIPNRSAELKKELPDGYTLQTIYGFLYKIVKINK